MIKTIKNMAASLAVAILLMVGTVGTLTQPVGALDAQGGANIAQPDNTPSDLLVVLSNIVNILLFAIGIISVIMLIVGGIRYTISNGKQDQITAARQTITYAIVGLVIAFLAYAIINWVIGGISS